MTRFDQGVTADGIDRSLNGSDLRSAGTGLPHRVRHHLQSRIFGSAITGEGVEALKAGLVELLPAEAGDAEAAVTGRVFKIDRGPGGEKIAYVRMFAGTVRTRQRLHVQTVNGADAEAKATAISVSDNGEWVRRPQLAAGEIGKLWGLGGVRIGDTIGQPPATETNHRRTTTFAPPTMVTGIHGPVRAPEAARGPIRLASHRLCRHDD